MNTSFAEDLLDGGELRRAENARIVNGIVTKRCGSRRMHTAALPGTVRGAQLWTPPSGVRQVVAIANGQLYKKDDAAGTFAAVSAGFNANDVARFVTARVSGQLQLFIACGNQLRYYDGSITLSTVTGGPPDAVDLALYKGRLYAISRGSRTLYGSQVSNPTVFTPAAGGLQEDVETFDNEPLVGLVVCGSSLILAKEDSLSRLTGIATTDIRIDRNTDGLSAEVGCIARGTLIPLEQAFFFLSDRGPYLGNESSVEYIGMKVGEEFDFANKAVWANAMAVHHTGRHEIWLTAPGLPSAGANNYLWVYDYRNRKWDGPWIKAARSLAPYERSNGSETVMRGDASGWVSEEDVLGVYKDDLNRDGTGGVEVFLSVTYPQLLFGDPSREKSMRGVQRVQANIEPGSSLAIQWFSERKPGVTPAAILPSKGYGMRDYPFRLGARGKRISIRMSHIDPVAVEIGGAVFEASLGSRARRAPAAVTGGEQSGLPRAVYVVPSVFTLGPGEVAQLRCVGQDFLEVEVPVAAVTWQSSDPTKATVSSIGVVSRVAAGNVTITATAGTLSAQALGTLT